MPSWWKRTQSYLSSHSNFFIVTGGIVGGAYLISNYAIAKFQQIQAKLVQDRSANENLRRRFAQNQEDCTFTVLALLPTVGDQLSARLNVEQLTESLRAQSSSSSLAAQTSDSPAPTSPTPQTESQQSSQPAQEHTEPAAAQPQAAPPADQTPPGPEQRAQSAEPSPRASPSLSGAKSTFNPLAKEFVPFGQRQPTPPPSSPSQPIKDQPAEQQQQQQQLDAPAAPETADAVSAAPSAPAQQPADAGEESVQEPTTGTAADGDALTESAPPPPAQAQPTAEPSAPQPAPIQPSRERLVQERQAKLKLWNELKIVSFSRTVTSLYCVALLTLQTHVQLNLIGRFAYLASIEAQMMSTELDGQLVGADWQDAGSRDQAGQFGLDHETERLYLTYSWWFLHRGWDQLATRVVQAVERTFSGLPVKAQITMNEMRTLVGSARSSVEYELCGESTKRSNFLDVLFPVSEEQELETLIQSGAVPADRALDTLRTNQRLRLLLDETKDIIESSDFSTILHLCLDRVFDVFFTTMSPTFGLAPSTPVGGGLSGHDEAGTGTGMGARIREITADEAETLQKGRSVRLASLFPAVARQSQLAIHGVPNEYIESLSDSKELRAFSAIIYAAWPPEASH
ncbi:uncharacterized protein PFL1_06676 [Pseudozyma flocculosa PF-1]|uniref:Related to Peroxisomal assembly protein PEX3 n=2 Tax=Pseudozyma flocculosa TaxID=84751 RepID=A0A5C3F8C5_9BASI|nr:uncharacterized protein PFL1_06676 [Pseudozyma flocculosa PF-1]EPQ25809.1 hypothetical protein PFL1_06676 [Pseudozyma flocculosa PF-1]SPO40490.1 related to Peroxisomal assembly protein PEX3 [Pseudozyma flocculosa]